VYSICVQRICTAYTTVLTLAVLSSVDQTTRLRAYVQRKIKDKINQKQKKFKSSFVFFVYLFSIM
jgi:small basic protein